MSDKQPNLTGGDYPVSALLHAIVAFKAVAGHYPSGIRVGAGLGSRLLGEKRDSVVFVLDRSDPQQRTTAYLDHTLSELDFVLEP